MWKFDLSHDEKLARDQNYRIQAHFPGSDYKVSGEQLVEARQAADKFIKEQGARRSSHFNDCKVTLHPPEANGKFRIELGPNAVGRVVLNEFHVRKAIEKSTDPVWLKVEIGENLKRTHELDRNSDGYAASSLTLKQSDWQCFRAENWEDRKEAEVAKQEAARAAAREHYRKPPEFLLTAQARR